MKHSYRIPKRLDVSRKIVLFDVESICVGIGSFALLFALNETMIGLGVGLALMWTTQKIKNKQKKRGVWMHSLYWLTGLIKLKRTPPSEYRTFKE